MDKYQQQILNVQNVINANKNEQIGLEIAMEIVPTNDGQVVYPGIHIIVEGAEEPIFISVGELKILSQAADKYCTNLIKQQNQNTSK